jgi:hypothetical protein
MSIINKKGETSGDSTMKQNQLINSHLVASTALSILFGFSLYSNPSHSSTPCTGMQLAYFIGTHSSAARQDSDNNENQINHTYYYTPKHHSKRTHKTSWSYAKPGCYQTCLFDNFTGYTIRCYENC